MHTSTTSAATVAEGQTISTGRFKPLVSIKSHKWLALFIFIIITLLGIPVAILKGKVTYSTMAVLLVSPQFVPNLDAEKGMDLDRNNYQLYIEQQQRLITRQDVLQVLLQRPEVRTLWLHADETESDSVTRLANSLVVGYKRGSPFISIALTDDHQEGLDLILNKLIDVYLKKSQEENLYGSGERIEVLQQRRDELLELISQRQKLRGQIADELGVTTFKEDNLNPYDNILIESTQIQLQARRTRVEAETRLQALTQGHPGETLLDAQVREMVANDSVLNNFKVKLVEQKTNLTTQIIGLTHKHPTRQQAEQEIAKIDHDIQQASEKLTQEIHTRLFQQSQGEVDKARRLEDALSEEIKKQRAQANHYSTLYNQALIFNKEIERAYKQLDKIDERMDFLTMESTAQGFVRMDTPANAPQASGGRKKILMVFIVIAMGLGMTIPILIDMLDRRLRTPGEVHKILGFAPMAWILERINPSTEQLAQDHLRRLALTLAREWQTHHTGYFVLTSVKPGGGTTTLTLELANIFSHLGIRALAMELNAFKPDLRYQNATSSAAGLATLLHPNTPRSLAPETLILPATATLPARLPIGQTPHRHLTTHGKLPTLLDQLHARYDLILMDTPPILLSADAELLGEIAGGVLLVVEAGQITPGELKRAAHLLERLNPPVVGAILNRVKVYEGGGYFADLLKEHHTGTKLPPSWISRLLWGE